MRNVDTMTCSFLVNYLPLRSLTSRPLASHPNMFTGLKEGQDGKNSHTTASPVYFSHISRSYKESVYGVLPYL